MHRVRERERTSINARRSIYTSHYLPKLNKNQINRVAFLMRTSFNMLTTNYLKKKAEKEEVNIINGKITTANNSKQQPTIKVPRDRKAYLNEYYEKNKEKMKEQIKKMRRIKHIK